jgi:hypothetical protein
MRVLRRALILDADGYQTPVLSADGRYLAIRGNDDPALDPSHARAALPADDGDRGSPGEQGRRRRVLRSARGRITAAGFLVPVCAQNGFLRDGSSRVKLGAASASLSQAASIEPPRGLLHGVRTCGRAPRADDAGGPAPCRLAGCRCQGSRVRETGRSCARPAGEDADHTHGVSWNVITRLGREHARPARRGRRPATTIPGPRVFPPPSRTERG